MNVSGFVMRVAVCGLLLVSSVPIHASTNMLGDPGFERYTFNNGVGYYVPANDAVWQEVGLGQASVRFNAGGWSAPTEMTSERPPGFSPGAAGYEGQGATQNSGVLMMQQDVVAPELLQAFKPYEAWVWLGGAGNDNSPAGPDTREEFGGWTIFWYANPNTADWTDQNAFQVHSAKLDFWGQPNSFVRVSGRGKVPLSAQGFRFRVEAHTWALTAPTQPLGTQVALDNAHFGLIEAPNLLTNGDFELDAFDAQFAGWNRPDVYWSWPTSTLVPLNLETLWFGSLGQYNYNTGRYYPFFGDRYTYGYDSYLHGAVNNAFTFGQRVNVNVPAGAQMVFSCYWGQGTNNSGSIMDLRRPLGRLEVKVEYLNGANSLGVTTINPAWPVAQNAANNNRYDQNGDRFFHVRRTLTPPNGTNQIGVYVRVEANCAQPPAEIFRQVVDDFVLSFKDEYLPPTPTPVPNPELVNPGAEQDWTGWTKGANTGQADQPVINPSVWVPNPPNRTGAKRFGVAIGVPGPYSNYMVQPISVTPGQQYRLGMWVKQNVETGSTEQARLIVTQDGWPGTETVVAQSPPGTNVESWTEYSGNFVAAGSLAYVGVRYAGQKSTWNPSGIHVDDLTMTIIGTPVPTSTPTPPPADLDNDGVPDIVEHAAPGAGQSSVYLDDSDRDGLLDGQEDTNRNGVKEANETSTRSQDTDGDQYRDGIERALTYDPLNANSPGVLMADNDNDWLPNINDLAPDNPDFDGDRFKDGYEVSLLGFDAMANAAQKPTMGDVNGDGLVSNLDALVTQSFFLGNLSVGSAVWGGAYRGFRNTDMNGDAFASNVDALIIQSFFLGNLQRLPL